MIFFFLPSCMVSYQDALKKFQESPVCCQSFREFTFEKININDTQSFKLDENSMSFLFPYGKSYFKAFELPQVGYPYHLLIKSYMLGEHIAEAHIFFPYIITLNENFEIVRSKTPYCLYLKKSRFKETMKETGGLGLKLEGFINFDFENKNEKYIVILTTEELLKKNIYRTYRKFVSIIVPGFVTLLPGPKDIAVIKASPMAHINITLKSGIPKNYFVAIDSTQKAFTNFMAFPEEGLQTLKQTTKENENIKIVSLEDFIKDYEHYVKPAIIKNDFPTELTAKIFLDILLTNMGLSFAITWNGGIASNSDQIELAKKMLEIYQNDRTEYEKMLNNDYLDKLNPKNQTQTTKGIIFQWTD